ncbi:MAG: hypothetical protein ABUT20_37210, partial [Bacteroidota bacterium]
MTRTLQQKNTRYLLIWLPLVLLLGTVVFYIMLTMHSHHMQEEQLGLKQQNVWKTFKAKPASVALQIPGEYSIDEGTGIPEKLRDKPRDTALQYNDNVEKINFKILTKQYSWNNKSYQLTTYVSSKEFFHLIVKVFATEAFIFLLLLLSIGVINRKSSRILWKPFYNTMKKTAAYDVVRNPAFELPKETGISEFN